MLQYKEKSSSVLVDLIRPDSAKGRGKTQKSKSGIVVVIATLLHFRLVSKHHNCVISNDIYFGRPIFRFRSATKVAVIPTVVVFRTFLAAYRACGYFVCLVFAREPA